MVVLGANLADAKGGPPRGTSATAEEQELLQATGPAGPQLVTQAQALEQQVGITTDSDVLTASNVGAAASELRASMSDLAKLITAGSYVAGVAFALGAIAKFQAHKINPTQVPISHGIVLLFIAAALIFLPAIFGGTGTGAPVDPRALPSPISGSDLLAAIGPVLREARAAGLTREGKRGPLLPSDATAKITTALEAHGASGRGLDAATAMGVLAAGAIVAGARA